MTTDHQHDIAQRATDRASIEVLQSQVRTLETELAALRAQLSSGPGPDRAEPGHQDGDRLRNDSPRSTSRRSLLGLAGASAIGAVGATLTAGGRQAAAADPDDVVRNAPNPVTSATTMTGSFNSPILGLFNNGTGDNASGLYMLTQSADAPTIRADNDGVGGLGGVAVAANAPGGRDIVARGSGRIAMVDHAFGTGGQYSTGEIHQSGGTFYAMTSADRRRVIAAPESVGVLTVIEPRRVYDSRTSPAQPGGITAGESRLISVADARSIDSGAVTVADVVPADATAILFNLTAVNTNGSGYLSVTPATTVEVSASTLNWIGDSAVVANFSVVGLTGDRNVRVHCGGDGRTDFALDVLGYHR